MKQGLLILQALTLLPEGPLTSFMALNEKGTIGAGIVTPYGLSKPSYESRGNPSFDTLDSPCATPAADQDPPPKDEYDTASVHPFSPFYSHPTTRTSFEQRASESKVNIAIYQHDLESGSRIAQSTDIPRSKKDCTVWPGSTSKKSLCCQQRSRWNPLRNLSRRDKLLVKILIVLLVVGAAVGLGIGIAKATGTGIWQSNNSESPIGHQGSHG